jgi:hypothetical protein
LIVGDDCAGAGNRQVDRTPRLVREAELSIAWAQRGFKGYPDRHNLPRPCGNLKRTPDEIQKQNSTFISESSKHEERQR